MSDVGPPAFVAYLIILFPLVPHLLGKIWVERHPGSVVVKGELLTSQLEDEIPGLGIVQPYNEWPWWPGLGGPPLAGFVA